MPNGRSTAADTSPAESDARSAKCRSPEQSSRISEAARDAFGSGQFGVSRNRGARTHKGLDVVTKPREMIFSPIDPSVRGIVIKGSGEWSDYKVKIFYAEGLLSGDVVAGQ